MEFDLSIDLAVAANFPPAQAPVIARRQDVAFLLREGDGVDRVGVSPEAIQFPTFDKIAVANEGVSPGK